MVQDGYLIDNINGETLHLHECFRSSVKSDNLGNTIERITNLKEGSLESDDSVRNAQNNIQNEINAIQREIEEEEARRKAVIAANIASVRASISRTEANAQREITRLEKNVGEETGQVVDALKAATDSKIVGMMAKIISMGH